jgi:predicted outer membrane repeat protein
MFQGNTAAVGGAVYMFNVADGASKARITNCSFTGNSASSGGGAVHIDSMLTNLTITASTFEANSAATQGGALEISNANVALSNCTLAHNTAPSGAALIGSCDNKASCTIDCAQCNINSNECTGNVSQQYGIVLIASSTLFDVSDSLLDGNTCQGILLAGAPSAQIVLTTTSVTRSNVSSSAFYVADVWAATGTVSLGAGVVVSNVVNAGGTLSLTASPK